MRTRRFLKSIEIIATLIMLSCAERSVASTIMYLDSVNTSANKNVSFSLFISNDSPFVGFQLDIVFPNVLKFLDGSVRLTSRASDHTVSAKVVSQGVLRIVVYSVSQSTLEGTTGAVLTVGFTSGTAPGIYQLQIQNAVVADSSQRNVLSIVYPGVLTLIAPHLEIAPQSVDFGSIPLYNRSLRSIAFTNSGNAPLNIKGITSKNRIFSLSDSIGFTVPSGSTLTREVYFSPSKKGSYSGSINVTSDDPSGDTTAIPLKGVAYAVNELRVGSANGRSGYTFHLPVSVNNMEPFTGLQFKLQLPSVAKYISGSIRLSSRATDHIVAADTTANELAVVVYSPSNSAFKDSSGVVLTLDLLVQGQGGSYSLLPSNAFISDSIAQNVMSAAYPGGIQVISPMLWLSTSSIAFGNVSAKDTARASVAVSNSGSDTLVISSVYIDNPLFKTSFSVPQSIPPGSKKDLLVSFHSMEEGLHTGHIVIRSNDVQNDPAYISLSANVYMPDILSVASGEGFKKEDGTIKINLDNMKAVTGIQCDVQVPPAISVAQDSIRLTSRKKDHVVIASVLSPGNLRIIAYSPSLSPFQSDTGAIIELPVRLGDTVGTFQVHLSNVVLSDTAGKNVLTGTSDGYFKIRSRKITVNVNLSSFWNMVSVPVIPDSYKLTDLFPSASSKAFRFDMQYVSADTLHNEYGYWLKFSSPSLISITGLPVILDTFSVHSGWNLIGSISSAVPVDSVAELPPGNVSSFYFGFAGGYRVADSIRPAMGYWVKVRGAGSLILRTDISRVYSSYEGGAPIWNKSGLGEIDNALVPSAVNATPLDTLNYFIISDADSFSQKLFFGKTSIDSLALLKYELPPTPPDGAFDARFGSGRFLEPLPETFDTTEFTVVTQTNHYPLTVAWHIIQAGIKYFFIEKGHNGTQITEMKGDSSLVISDTAEKAFTLRCISNVVSVSRNKISIPLEINLEQNYPNPFNPSTVIRFDLPGTLLVDLSIYDVQGRKIKTLAHGYYSSGSHEVTFDGGGLSSGVYIAKLVAGGQILTNKIVLLK